MTDEPREEENPPDPDAITLAGEASEPGSMERFPSRLDRYAKARRRSLEMAAFLRTKGTKTDSDVFRLRESGRLKCKLPEWQAARNSSVRLIECGEWLQFRHYPTVDQVRLHQARFCKQTKLCPLCAIRRSVKQLGVYLERYEFIQAQEPHLKPYLITLTVKNGVPGQDDLPEVYEHLKWAQKMMLTRWRQLTSGNGRGRSSLAAMAGAVGSYEFTNKGKGWHPHLHLIALFDHELSEAEMEAIKAEWCATTGCSDMKGQDVRPINPLDPVSGFVEVFKYSMKFQDMQLSDNWRAHLQLEGQRLLLSCGCFWGVRVPESLTDEVLEDLPYIDLFYRYLPASGVYTLIKDVHHSETSLHGPGWPAVVLAPVGGPDREDVR